MNADTTHPHLLQLLAQEYTKQCDEQLQHGEIDQETYHNHQSHVMVFWEWANRYLSENRPVFLQQNVDSNYLVQLTNNQAVLISPPAGNLRGTMAGGGGAVSMSNIHHGGNVNTGGAVAVSAPEHQPRSTQFPRPAGIPPRFYEPGNKEHQNMRTPTGPRDLTKPRD